MSAHILSNLLKELGKRDKMRGLPGIYPLFRNEFNKLTIQEHECYTYKSAHVLLNLLKKFGKRDKMQGLPSILSLFRNEFNKFNNTIAQMLDSIYHMILRLL